MLQIICRVDLLWLPQLVNILIFKFDLGTLAVDAHTEYIRLQNEVLLRHFLVAHFYCVLIYYKLKSLITINRADIKLL